MSGLAAGFMSGLGAAAGRARRRLRRGVGPGPARGPRAPGPLRRTVRLRFALGPQARRRLLALAVTPALLTAGYMLWLRDSSLVRVRSVTVTGLTQPDAGRIRAALESAARGMTTLHVRRGELEQATTPFPVVRSIEVRPDFPSGMRIEVSEYRAVAVLESGSARVPVAGDGLILVGAPVDGALPLVRVAGDLPRGRLAPGQDLSAVKLAAAVPAALAPRVEEIVRESEIGLTVPLEEGPRIVFGDATRARAKWAAVARVLIDPDAAGAEYVDVRIPERPAAGGLPVETVAPVAPAGDPTAEAPAADAAEPAPVPDPTVQPESPVEDGGIVPAPVPDPAPVPAAPPVQPGGGTAAEPQP